MRTARKTARAQRGFTLVELMMVLAILSIMATLGALGFREIILSNQREAAVNYVKNKVALARSEAIRRGRRVGICLHDPTVSGYVAAACDNNLTTNDWETQWWLFFQDIDGAVGSSGNLFCLTGAPPDDEDCAFVFHEPEESSGRLVYNSGAANNYAFYITSTGQLGTYDGSGIFQDTTSVQFWFCDSREKGKENRLITIGPGSARVRVSPGTGDAQTPECVP